MHVFLWILQGALALLLLSGGAYKFSTRDALATQFAALSRGAWGAVGVVEVVAGLLLILPAAFAWRPVLTPVAAAVVAVESLVLAVVYARQSRTFSASNPLVYAVVMGIVAAIVAYGRFVLHPIG